MFNRRYGSKKKKRRDYWRKSFRNPYFLKDRLPRRTKAPRLKAAAGILSLLGILAILFFHPFFYVADIEKEGLETIKGEEIDRLVRDILEERRFLFFKGRNIFLFNKEKIKKNISAHYSLKSLKIKTDFPRALVIVLEEKKPEMVWEVGKDNRKFYLLDEEGKVIQEASWIDSGAAFLTLPRIYCENFPAEIQLNLQAIPPSTKKFISFLFENISRRVKIKTAYFTLADQEGRVVNVVTEEGWKIILDRQNDWDKQLQVLAIILRDKIKDRSKLHYMDVRYENRSYYQ